MAAMAAGSVFRAQRLRRSIVSEGYAAEASRSVIVAIEPTWQTLLDEPSWSRIAERAYLLWEQEGRPAGRDEAHWKQAEAALRMELRQAMRSPTQTTEAVQS